MLLKSLLFVLLVVNPFAWLVCAYSRWHLPMKGSRGAQSKLKKDLLACHLFRGWGACLSCHASAPSLKSFRFWSFFVYYPFLVTFQPLTSNVQFCLGLLFLLQVTSESIDVRNIQRLQWSLNRIICRVWCSQSIFQAVFVWIVSWLLWPLLCIFWFWIINKSVLSF